uniref:Spindle assembly abnormal protein 6 N-terminal domain-containing protein n=1 Tax=Tetraselmis chuii TaxID=63592 RepID=A0A7S1X654_9CHLO|mmetsp:Transcript_32338/g.57875  ORF Transcript_32338/g.57875 Transcript_32338/m.57875 type:complete len:243 (+) Transcript_32338:365-1093(+)|eukprot:CAMPEP_0177795892 /NCGR_PEP_ID=MMETSP0491_2-20121128/26483_1 /TAXON_ID=63592 /ORGANISM="Tetraselmis chuii, Strain PLY429" /LENGTH=242 /DNA_ID=CAMNT_0019318769 /DNA_START=292 /DNA_END=1020 /DNA_ORIENTATION=-
MASAQSYQPVSRDAIDSSLAQNLDFATLDDLDPSLADGFYVYYEREVPFELRSSEGSDLPSEVGALEAIRVKVLLLGDQNNPEALKVELSSESNLFFHYIHQMSPASFKELQEGQKLMVDFAEYPAVLLRMLNHCIKEPHSYLAVFVMHRNGEARLDFIQNMEYKFVELLSCRFVASPDEVVRQHITYRYNAIKSRLALMQARLADVNALVKVKNPSLLLQLQRTPPRVPSNTRTYGRGGGY